MISIEKNEPDNIFVITPDQKISQDDIATLNQQINDYINAHDKVPNLVIRADSFPAWKDFDAMSEHIAFIRNHHQIVKKVAIVSDSTLVWLVRPFVDRFTGAKVRRFSANRFDQAYDWALGEEDNTGQLTPIEGLPNDVIAVTAKGTITAQDYQEMLVPLVNSKLGSHDKLKLLFVFGPDFDGYSAGAVWDDARFGLSHFTSFSKVAIVTDVEWLRISAKVFGPLMPGEVMVFPVDQLDDAKDWIKR